MLLDSRNFNLFMQFPLPLISMTAVSQFQLKSWIISHIVWNKLMILNKRHV